MVQNVYQHHGRERLSTEIAELMQTKISKAGSLRHQKLQSSKQIKLVRSWGQNDRAILKIIDQAKATGRTYLMEHESKAILESLGITTTKSMVARTEDEAVEIFQSLAFSRGPEGALPGCSP